MNGLELFYSGFVRDLAGKFEEFPRPIQGLNKHFLGVVNTKNKACFAFYKFTWTIFFKLFSDIFLFTYAIFYGCKQSK